MDPITDALKNNVYWDKVSIGTYLFKIQRVRNIDKLIDSISEEEFSKDERLPYWADLWPSAIALSEYLVENENLMKGKKILELGCGLGLVGITAAAMGGDVLFTDYDSNALKFTQSNFIRNFERSASVQLLDWREPGDHQSFDIILAADIIYEKRWLEPVINVLEHKLSPDGVAYLANPDRTVGRNVFKMIENKKWRFQTMLKPTMVYDKLHHIQINRVTKC